MTPDEFGALRVPFYLIVDTEATCDQSDFPRAERETIELGAVLVDGSTLTVTGEFQSFVRPSRHPILSQYCTNLTTISQESVDAAPSFSDVMVRFRNDFLPKGEVLFCAWGPYDRRQLKRDCQYHSIAYPFTQHVDLAQIFSQRARVRRRLGLKNALSLVGLEPQGRAHRGIDDARNLAKLMPWCLGQQSIPDPKARRSNPNE